MVSKSALVVAATIVVSGLLAAPSAHAQIVNVQSAMSSKTKPGFSFAVTGSVKWFTGNADILFISVSPITTFKAGKHLLLGFGNVSFARSGGADIIFRTHEHLRYRYKANSWLTPEAFVQHAFDKFKRLNIRTLVGAGPSIRVIDRKQLSLAWGVAYMFEYEKLSTTNDEMGVPLSDSGEIHKDHRGSSYLMGSFNLDDRVALVETLFVQPRLTDPSDVRLLSDSTINVSLTKRVTLSNSFIIAYDRNPPVTVRRLDTRLLSSLTLKL